MDCEATIVFTKDPQYIVNAHSWPDEIKKKEKKEKEAENGKGKTAQKDSGNVKKGFMDKLGTGVTDIFSKKKPQNSHPVLNNEEDESADKGK